MNTLTTYSRLTYYSSALLEIYYDVPEKPNNPDVEVDDWVEADVVELVDRIVEGIVYAARA